MDGYTYTNNYLKNPQVERAQCDCVCVSGTVFGLSIAQISIKEWRAKVLTFHPRLCSQSAALPPA